MTQSTAAQPFCSRFIQEYQGSNRGICLGGQGFLPLVLWHTRVIAYALVHFSLCDLDIGAILTSEKINKSLLSYICCIYAASIGQSSCPFLYDHFIVGWSNQVSIFVHSDNVQCTCTCTLHVCCAKGKELVEILKSWPIMARASSYNVN